jgi:uncharacterized RDD family membrane protein YckC
MTIDTLVTSNIINKFTSYPTINDEYDALVVEYDTLEDQYQIYLYDEDNNRVFNKEITDEQTNAFLQDPRVNEIKELVVKDQNKIYTYDALEITTSSIISLIITYFIIPLIFASKATLGKKAFHLVIYQQDQLLSKKKYYLEQILYVLINVILGIGTLGIIWIGGIIAMVITKDNQSIVDLIFKRKLIVDPLYLGKDINSEEKEQEEIAKLRKQQEYLDVDKLN